MKLNNIFLIKFLNFFSVKKPYFYINSVLISENILHKDIFSNNSYIFSKKFEEAFFKKVTINKTIKNFFFLNKFILFFLENFFKKNILVNLKKGSNKIFIKQISQQYFYSKFFKKNLKISKQILGILYYTILLKDSNIFINFFRRKLEDISIKLHKKLLLGLKKLIHFVFEPHFKIFGLLGIFLNIRGKLGVSGNAKKRKYCFYFGKHSITKRTLKFSHKQTPIWTYTGVLNLSFYLFF